MINLPPPEIVSAISPACSEGRQLIRPQQKKIVICTPIDFFSSTVKNRLGLPNTEPLSVNTLAELEFGQKAHVLRKDGVALIPPAALRSEKIPSEGLLPNFKSIILKDTCMRF